MSDFKQPTSILLFVSLLTVFFIAVFSFSIRMLETNKKIAVAPSPMTMPPPDPFKDINLEAQAAYVFDMRTGKTLFSKNEEAQLPLASLTKVMTALIASEMPDDTVVAFGKDEKWNLKELLDYTLMVSSNNGASAIAGASGAWLGVNQKEVGADVFVQKMNDEARALALSQTFFLNPNGLDVNDTLSGAYGSAKDMVNLFAYILRWKPALLEATTYESLQLQSESGVLHTARNTNILARTIPGLLASKTGYTDLAGGNLVIAFDVGPMHPVIIAVLGSSQDGRFTDVEKLIAASVAKIGQGE